MKPACAFSRYFLVRSFPCRRVYEQCSTVEPSARLLSQNAAVLRWSVIVPVEVSGQFMRYVAFSSTSQVLEYSQYAEAYKASSHAFVARGRVHKIPKHFIVSISSLLPANLHNPKALYPVLGAQGLIASPLIARGYDVARSTPKAQHLMHANACPKLYAPQEDARRSSQGSAPINLTTDFCFHRRSRVMCTVKKQYNEINRAPTLDVLPANMHHELGPPASPDDGYVHFGTPFLEVLN